jgi:hypothetical protein
MLRLRVYTALLAAVLCSASVLPAHASDNKEAARALSQSVGAKTGSIKMAAVTPDQLKEAAAPTKESDPVYAQRYQSLVDAAKAGATLFIWQHVGAPEAYGYAAIKDGKLMARLTMVIN